MAGEKLVFLGNCQAYALSRVYEVHIAPLESQTVTFVTSYSDSEEGRQAIAQADVVIEQRLDFLPGVNGNDLRAGVRRLEFPAVAAGFIWPYASQPHPKNYVIGEFRGPYPAQLGDAYLNQMIKRGTPPSDAVDRYLNLNVAAHSHVDRLAELYMDRQRTRDQATGYNLADVIERYFREEPLFLTPDHPTMRIFRELFTQFCDHFGVPPDYAETAMTRTKIPPFPRDGLPVHPGIIQHFGLGFADESTRYRHFNQGAYTFREYASRYMAFEDDADLERGILLSEAGDDEAALAVLRPALERTPRSGPGYYGMSVALTRRGEIDEAIAAARKAVDLDPEDHRFHSQLGALLARIGERDQAIVSFNRAAALDGDAYVHAHLGGSLLRAEDAVAAEREFREASRLNSDVASFHAGLGHALSQQNRIEDAVAAVRCAVTLAGHDAHIRALLGSLLLRAGDAAGAERELREATRLAPDVAGFHANLSHTLSHQGRFDEAVAAVRRATDLNPGDAHHRALLGTLLLRAGSAIAAEQEFREAIRLAPEIAGFHGSLAHALAQQDRIGEAIAALRHAANLDGGDQHVRGFLEALLQRAGPRGDGDVMPQHDQTTRTLGKVVDRAQPSTDIFNLPWLPLVDGPGTWPEQLKSLELESDDTAVWRGLVRLANTSMDFVRAGRLDRALQRRFGGEPPPGLATKPVRLAVLGSSTLAHLLPGIRVAALRRGIWLTAYEADYGQYLQELSDPGSALHSFAPTAVLFAFDTPYLTRAADAACDSTQANEIVTGVLSHIAECWRLARDAFRCAIVQQNLLPVFPALLGNNEHRLPGSRAGLTKALNTELRDAADQAGVDLIALDDRAAIDGLGRWHDPVMWLRAKQEISSLAAPMYGELVGRVLAAKQGRSFKCLVLDLDNTLWGGVIGDDGLDGIVLGQGSAMGEAFVALQNYALQLSRRGIILAVCSKNDEANALAPFEQHPDMVLKRSAIACFVANWNDKASNIRTIAQQLNIGLDSLVFLDDNPFERNLVRGELPMVAVPEVPDDPALIPACLANAGYFEGTSITDEDRDRAGQYQANLARTELLTQATDLRSYLRGLDMRLVWRQFDRTGLQRIVQLINKTNQFNLTTRRYTDDAVLAVMDDPGAFGLQLRLLDRFGDNGIIAIVIGRATQDASVLVDTWLMSCRVLGRQVEEATLLVTAQLARRLGARRLIGEYQPTAKNAMVRDHYEKLGFSASDQTADSSSRFVLDLDHYAPPDILMDIQEG